MTLNILVAVSVDRRTKYWTSATEHPCVSLWRLFALEALCSTNVWNHDFMPTRYSEIETVRDNEGLSKARGHFSIAMLHIAAQNEHF